MLLSTEVDPEKVVEEANKLIRTLEGFLPSVLTFFVNVIIAILILIVGKFIIKFILKIMNRCLAKSKVEVSVQKFLDSLVKASLYVILIIVMCGQVGVQTSSFIAVLGSAGLTLGLALQGSLSNFAGGVLILILKPFKIGDYIADGVSGKEGTVNRIDLFYTYIDTLDNKKLIIPNGALSNSNIVNYTANQERMLDLSVGISYSSSIEDAKNALKEVIDAEDRILKNKDITIFVRALEDSQVTMGIRAWTKTSDYWPVYFKITEENKKALDRAGVEIPYNQMSVHIVEDKN